MVFILNFSYGEATSHQFGLGIGRIGDGGIESINTYGNMEIIGDASASGQQYYYGVKYNGSLEFPMEVYNRHGEWYEMYEIQAIQEWLFGRRNPALLTIFDTDKGNESYECWLVEPQMIKLDTRVIGWKFTVKCTTNYSISGEVESIHTIPNASKQPNIIHYHNFSNIEDYTYPELYIKNTSTSAVDIQIQNHMDIIKTQMGKEEPYTFRINNLIPNQEVYINNKLGVIKYVNENSGLDNKILLASLEHFNFFRLTSGYNKLQVTFTVDKIQVSGASCVLRIVHRCAKANGGF